MSDRSDWENGSQNAKPSQASPRDVNAAEKVSSTHSDDPLKDWFSSTIPSAGNLEDLLKKFRLVADAIALSPQDEYLPRETAPIDDLQQLSALGLLTVALPTRYGGFGFGTEAGGHSPLLRLLSIVGGADLVLGRLFEGHVNALILISAYGSQSQIEAAAKDVHLGRLFGVWNTGSEEPVRLKFEKDRATVHGVKTFASGAPFIHRPIVTGETESGGWQMTLLSMEALRESKKVSTDKSFWKPIGMESSQSYAISFDDVQLQREEVVGRPGDFYRDPLFRGGAMRFAAVQVGAVLRLHKLFACWIRDKNRSDDPYQIARLGEIALKSQEAILWIERAANVAEKCFNPNADKLSSEHMVECANMTRVAVERLATATMQIVTAGVGAHGLMRPNKFEKIIRDLTMYLRQPAPDQILADIGRMSLRKSNLRSDSIENGAWTEAATESSLPPSYFQQIYQRSSDPWNFETSVYESDKYQETLSSLPREIYKQALEIGCSIGVFTRMVASRCQALLAVDVSERAIEIARARCADQHQVRFAKMQVPHEMPEGQFALIIVSEVAYYWSEEDLSRAIEKIARLQTLGDHLILVHYTIPVSDYPLTGDQVHDIWIKRPEWRVVRQRRFETFRLDVLERQA